MPFPDQQDTVGIQAGLVRTEPDLSGSALAETVSTQRNPFPAGLAFDPQVLAVEPDLLGFLAQRDREAGPLTS